MSDDPRLAVWAETQREALAALGHPVYVVSGVPLRGIGTVEDEQGTVRGAAAMHDVGASVLAVQTDAVPRPDGLDDELRARLIPWTLDDSELPGTTEDELRAAFQKRMDATAERLAATPIAERSFPVDGAPATFAFLEVDGNWIAAREHQDAWILVMGRALGTDGLAVERVPDPAAHVPSG